MRIKVYFRDEFLGTGTSYGDTVQWDSEHGLEETAEHYERQGYTGVELLKIMLERLHGHTWAVEVPDEEAPQQKNFSPSVKPSPFGRKAFTKVSEPNSKPQNSPQDASGTPKPVRNTSPEMGTQLTPPPEPSPLEVKPKVTTPVKPPNASITQEQSPKPLGEATNLDEKPPDIQSAESPRIHIRDAHNEANNIIKPDNLINKLSSFSSLDELENNITQQVSSLYGEENARRQAIEKAVLSARQVWQDFKEEVDKTLAEYEQEPEREEDLHIVTSSPIGNKLQNLRIEEVVVNEHSSINKSFRVRLEGGVKGIYKPEKGTDPRNYEAIQGSNLYKRETLAPLIAHIMGWGHLVPPTVMRAVEAQQGIGSLQHLIAGMTTPNARRKYDQDMPLPDDVWDGPELLAQAAAYDYLVGQVDGNDENWLVPKPSRMPFKKKAPGIVLIDRSLTLAGGLERMNTIGKLKNANYILHRTTTQDVIVPPIVPGVWKRLEFLMRNIRTGDDDSFTGIDNNKAQMEMAIALTKFRYANLVRGSGGMFGSLTAMNGERLPSGKKVTMKTFFRPEKNEPVNQGATALV